jgi:hypothetical protein
MKKLMVVTFILLLMFSGSVIASSSQKDTSSRQGSTESLQVAGTVNPDGNTCWRCTSYAYHNGFRVCVSGYWSSNCPVYN